MRRAPYRPMNIPHMKPIPADLAELTSFRAIPALEGGCSTCCCRHEESRTDIMEFSLVIGERRDVRLSHFSGFPFPDRKRETRGRSGCRTRAVPGALVRGRPNRDNVQQDDARFRNLQNCWRVRGGDRPPICLLHEPPVRVSRSQVEFSASSLQSRCGAQGVRRLS